jgi:hypothetical protein
VTVLQTYHRGEGRHSLRRMSLDLLASRMMEQAAPWTPWSRRTWEPGTVVRLRELSEATRWAHEGVLSDAAVDWYRKDLLPLIGQDPGLRVGAVQQQLQDLLKRPIVFGSQPQRRLEVLTSFVQDSYMDQWKRHLVAEQGANLERASRFLVSHAIDSGLDPRWLRNQTQDAMNDGATTIDIVDLMSSLAAAEPLLFTGIVLLNDVPHPEVMRHRPNWLNPRATNHVLRSQGEDPTRSQGGSLRFEVAAADPLGAARQVYDEMERLAGRTGWLRSPKRLSYTPTWCVGGDLGRLRLQRPDVNISVMSLMKTGRLYSGSSSTALDDALLLASGLLTGADSIAISGAWAALESLLTTGADWVAGGGRTSAADRAAAVVAAAWPRAELTALSHQIKRSEDSPSALKARMAEAGDDNVERCRLLLHHVKAHPMPTFKDSATNAAALRMAGLRADPKATLRRVEGYVRSSFRRLYRQRNIVLHGGSGRSVAVLSTMRTAGPLVGALLDRLSHGVEVSGLEPLDVVARARVALDAVGPDDVWDLHALLPD